LSTSGRITPQLMQAVAYLGDGDQPVSLEKVLLDRRVVGVLNEYLFLKDDQWLARARHELAASASPARPPVNGAGDSVPRQISCRVGGET
jgi:hypothetical protein